MADVKATPVYLGGTVYSPVYDTVFGCVDEAVRTLLRRNVFWPVHTNVRESLNSATIWSLP